MQSNPASKAAPPKYSEKEVARAAVWEAIPELLSGAWDTPPVHILVHRGVRFRAHIRDLSLRRGSAMTVVLVCEEDPLPPDGEIAHRFRLTPRETEVARLLARRCSNKEIAKELGLSPNTVWRHTDSVLAKLGVSTRRHVMDKLCSA
jgi:DNA-binding CsgD family transcriptional regulator